MRDIFSASLKAKKLPPYVVYWNSDMDWILIDETGDEVASMYRKTLVEKQSEAAGSRETIDDARVVERRIHGLMARQGKQAASLPPTVAEYFEMR